MKLHSTVVHWADVLSATPVSVWLQNELWVIPTSQSIHIVCVGIVFGSAIVISSRLLNIGFQGRSASQLANTLIPWMYGALAGLATTGGIQTLAEPMRQFVAPAYWLKMAMILVVAALTLWFARTIRANARSWDIAARRPASAKLFAVVSLVLWVAIIACGRFIGYTYQLYL